MIYMIGVPGVGKTTAMVAALGPGDPKQDGAVPYVVHGDWLQIGKERAGFGGTDALAMDAQPKVIEWLRTKKPERVIAEGDRLANAKFFQAVQDLGYDLLVVYLHAPRDVVAQRRQGRGSNQNETWLAGRETKVRRLAEDVTFNMVQIDATRPASEVAADLRRLIA